MKQSNTWDLLVASLILFLVVLLPASGMELVRGSSDQIKIDFFRGEFTISQDPFLNRTVALMFSISPIQDSPNTTVKLILPPGIKVENSVWNNIKVLKDEKLKLKTNMKVVDTGEWRIQAYVESNFNGYKIAQLYYM